MGICCVPQELKQGLCDRLKGVVGREITGKSRREGTKNKNKGKKKEAVPVLKVFRL